MKKSASRDHRCRAGVDLVPQHHEARVRLARLPLDRVRHRVVLHPRPVSERTERLGTASSLHRSTATHSLTSSTLGARAGRLGSARSAGDSLRRRDFRGRTIVVTGGAGGIGRALARRFGGAGARVAIVDLPTAPAGAARDELSASGIACVAVPCDITDPDQVRSAMAAVREAFGPIDVLINNAGIVHRSAFAETRPDVFRRVMEVNLFGALHCTQACLADLVARRGLIIAISSIAGLAPLYGRSGYAASKHAMHGLFESLGAEVADQGVRVLMVCPSFVESGLEASTLGGDGQRIARPRSKVGRLGDPDDVAAAILKAAQAGRRRLVLTPVGKISALLSCVAPGLYERLMIRSLRSELGGS